MRFWCGASPVDQFQREWGFGTSQWKNKSHVIVAAFLICFLHSDPIVITAQAFMQVNEVVPLSMNHQSLYVNMETQVAIAGIILAGVYVLIIFEVNGLWSSFLDDEWLCAQYLLLKLKCVPGTVQPEQNTNMWCCSLGGEVYVCSQLFNNKLQNGLTV